MTGAEKEKAAANFIPTSVVGSLELYLFLLLVCDQIYIYVCIHIYDCIYI